MATDEMDIALSAANSIDDIVKIIFEDPNTQYADGLKIYKAKIKNKNIPEFKEAFDKFRSSFEMTRLAFPDFLSPDEKTGLNLAAENKENEVYMIPEDMEGMPFYIEDGIDILHNLDISKSMPLVLYKANATEAWYDIFDLETTNVRKMDLEKWKSAENTIYAFLWNRADDPIDSKNVSVLRWTLQDNVLSYTYTDNDPIDFILNTFPLKVFKMESGNQNIKFTLPIGNFFNPDVLLHLITVHPKLDDITVLEFEEPQYNKYSLKLNYNGDDSRAGILIKMTDMETTFECTRVKNIDSLKNYLIKMMQLYLSNFDIIVKEYQKFVTNFYVPSVQKVIKKTNTKSSGKQTMEKIVSMSNKGDNLSELKNWGLKNNVKIFGTGYASKCAKPRQPSLADAAENGDNVKMFDLPTDSGQTVECKLKCPPEFPFPGSSAKRDELIPCCFSESQDRQDKHDTDIGKAAKNGKETASRAFITPGKKGILPYSFIKGVDFKRMAAENGNNVTNMSLLNCLNHVMNKNFTIANLSKLHFPVFMQELYNHNSVTLNDKTYLDSKMYIHGLEFLFGVNIFVIFDNKEETFMRFEIPMCKNGYIKPKLFEKSVLLYRNRGSEREERENNRYEIVLGGESQNSVYGLKPEETNILFDMFRHENEEFIFNKNGLFLNYLDQINYMKMFKPVAQRINSDGKMVGMTIKQKWGEFLIECLPSCPLNLPLSNENTPAPNLDNVLKTFPGSKYKIVDNIVYFWLGNLENAFSVKLTNDNTEMKFYEYQLMKRNSMIIQYLIRWLLHQDKETIFDDSLFIPTTSKMTDIQVRRKLPLVEDKEDKMRYLTKIMKTVGNKISLDADFLKAMKNFVVKNVYMPIQPPFQVSPNCYIPVDSYYFWSVNKKAYFSSIDEYIAITTPLVLVVKSDIQKSLVPYIFSKNGEMSLLYPVKTVSDGLSISNNWKTKRQIIPDAALDMTDNTKGDYILFIENFDQGDNDHLSGTDRILKKGDDFYVVLEW